MQYNQVWTAVDKLAELQGLSPSGLAKKAGLDATTFNKSKRLRPDGKKRWPSLESINKIIEVSGISFDQFCHLADSSTDDNFNYISCTIPFIKLSKLKNCVIDDNVLVTDDWKKIRFPDRNENIFALEVTSSKFEPIFPDGTILIISKNSEIRRNDRIIILYEDGNVDVKTFIRRTASTLEVTEVANPKSELSVPIKNIKLINRIIWASQ